MEENILDYVGEKQGLLSELRDPLRDPQSLLLASQGDAPSEYVSETN